jgi:hypothetical protein
MSTMQILSDTFFGANEEDLWIISYVDYKVLASEAL